MAMENIPLASVLVLMLASLIITFADGNVFWLKFLSVNTPVIFPSFFEKESVEINSAINNILNFILIVFLFLQRKAHIVK